MKRFDTNHIQIVLFDVIRVEFFQDAAIWANIGVGENIKDEKLKNLADARNRIQSVNYQRVDLTRMNYEVYFYEKPFFNKPYLFVAFVIDNKEGPSYFSYLRPDGAYFEELAKRVNVSSFNMEEIYDTFVPIDGESDNKKSLGLPLYGKSFSASSLSNTHRKNQKNHRDFLANLR